MNKLALRITSLSFAVVVTGFLVARAAGCTSSDTPKVEPVSPTSTPPPVTPTTPSDPGKPGAPPFPAPSETPGDAGPKASMPAPPNPHAPEFLPATKAAMPILRPDPAPAESTQQQAQPPQQQ